MLKDIIQKYKVHFYLICGALVVVALASATSFGVAKSVTKSVGFESQVATPYQMYTPTSTQIATSTKWTGNLNPQYNNNFDLGVYGNAWQDIMASGTVRAGYFIGDGSSLTGVASASSTAQELWNYLGVGRTATTTITGDTLASGVISPTFNLGKFYVDTSGNVSASGTLYSKSQSGYTPNIQFSATGTMFATPTDAAGNSAFVLDTTASAATTNLLSVRNNGTEKFIVDSAGNATINEILLTGNLGIFYGNNTNKSLLLKGSVDDGATAISMKIGNTGSLFTAGAKIISFFSDSMITERAYFDLNGDLGIAGGGYATSTLGNTTSTYLYSHPARDLAGYSAFTLNTTSTLATADVFTVRNNGAQLFSISPTTSTLMKGTLFNGYVKFASTIQATSLPAAGASDSTICIASDDSVKKAAGACTVSALRYKANILPLKNGLKSLLKFEPVNFTLKENNTKKVGLIAETVEKIDPKLAIYQDGQIRNYDQIGVLAYIIAGIKDFYAQVMERFTNQDAKIQDLQKQVNELKALLKR